MKSYIKFIKAQLLLGFFLLLTNCSQNNIVTHITGNTMGTTYSIKLITDTQHIINSTHLKYEIDSVLTEVNRQMSTYIPDSEISLFNSYHKTTPFLVSQDFFFVIEEAQKVSKLTGGAFDITVMPLVSVWGFGPGKDDTKSWAPPDSNIVLNNLNRVGYQNLQLKLQTLIKTDTLLSIDLNAIAKGFGVDKIAKFLETQNIDQYLVEIGGEIRSKGNNLKSKPWSIGIDFPEFNAVQGEKLSAIVSLSDQAMATSGDYRSYYKYADKYYSHTIDPRTGYPAKSYVASATVIAPTCTEADAIATALMVLGEKDGLALIESLEGFEALLILRENTETRIVKSSGMNIKNQ